MKDLIRFRKPLVVLLLLLLALAPAVLASAAPVAWQDNGVQGEQMIMSQVERRISAFSDDAEEQLDGSVANKGRDLELGVDDLGKQYVGLRFQGLAIPQGILITEAYLVFTASEDQASATNLSIAGQAADNPTTFAGNQLYDITVRPKTAAKMAWNGVPAWLTDTTYQSPNLASIVQEIVNRPGWSSGNAMAFIIEGTGRRTAYSFDGDAAKAPLLKVTYGGTCHTLTTAVLPPASGTVVADPAPNCEGSKYYAGTQVELTGFPSSGYRFDYWSGDAAASGTTNPATITVDADKSVIANFSVSFVGPVEHAGHTIDDDNIGGTIGNGDGIVNCGETVDLGFSLLNTGVLLASGVTASVDSPSPHVTWSGGTTSSFGDIVPSGTATGTPKLRFEVGPGAPDGHEIVFELDIFATDGGPWQDTFNESVVCGVGSRVDLWVQASSDDAEEEIATGEIWTKGGDLELGADQRSGTPVPQFVGIRFAGVALPPGATITNAYLEFTASETQSSPTSVRIYAEASDSAPAYSGTAGNISSRPRSATSVQWSSVPAWPAEGGTHQTPDLSSLIQQIIDRPGWTPGNALAFDIVGEAANVGRRTAWSYDGAKNEGDLTKAPRLVVTFGWQGQCFSLDTLVSPAGTGQVSAMPGPTCGGDRYFEGTQVELTATPTAPGYAFGSWSGGASGTTSPTTVVVDANMTVTANFVQATCYGLTAVVLPIVDPPVGEVRTNLDYNCGGQTYVAGTVLQVNPVARGGWEFDSWGGANAGDLVDLGGGQWQLTMNSSKTLTATFKEACRFITINVSPEGSGTVQANPPPNCTLSKYLPGTRVELRALPVRGYILQEWTGDASGSTSPAKIVMDGNKSVTANFTQGKHRVWVPTIVRGK